MWSSECASKMEKLAQKQAIVDGEQVAWLSCMICFPVSLKSFLGTSRSRWVLYNKSNKVPFSTLFSAQYKLYVNSYSQFEHWHHLAVVSLQKERDTVIHKHCTARTESVIGVCPVWLHSTVSTWSLVKQMMLCQKEAQGFIQQMTDERLHRHSTF